MSPFDSLHKFYSSKPRGCPNIPSFTYSSSSDSSILNTHGARHATNCIASLWCRGQLHFPSRRTTCCCCWLTLYPKTVFFSLIFFLPPFPYDHDRSIWRPIRSAAGAAFGRVNFFPPQPPIHYWGIIIISRLSGWRRRIRRMHWNLWEDVHPVRTGQRKIYTTTLGTCPRV